MNSKIPKNFLRKKLKNGMTLLFESRNLPVVSLSITNRFGSAFESPEIKGIAHFIEHLVFTGTKTRSHEQISREIEKKGGILNAFTGTEATSFWVKLPSEHFLKGLEILSDMLLNPTFNNKKFEKEKKVILEEIKMYNDDPHSAAYIAAISSLYKTPFGDWTLGTEKTISSLKRNQVYKYYKENYNPKNYIVTIVGQLSQQDLEKTINFIEKHFKPNNKNQKIKEISKINKDIIIERANIDQVNMFLSMHSPLKNTKEYYALEVLDSYLAKGMSSRLFLEIREKRGLAYTVSSDIESEKSYSHYMIFVGTKKSAIPIVKKLILKEIKDISKMSESDLKTAKIQLMGLKKVRSEESISVMNSLMYEEISGNAESYYNYEEKINSVSLKQVKNLAKRLIKKYSLAAVVPKQ